LARLTAGTRVPEFVQQVAFEFDLKVVVEVVPVTSIETTFGSKPGTTAETTAKTALAMTPATYPQTIQEITPWTTEETAAETTRQTSSEFVFRMASAVTWGTVP
jgi:hypothetical protein